MVSHWVFESLRFLLCVVGIILVCHFFDGLFPRRSMKVWVGIAYILIASSVVFISNGFGILWFNLAITLVSFCVIVLVLFKVTLYDAITYGVVIYVTWASIEVVFELFLRLAASQLGVTSYELLNQNYIAILIIEFLCRLTYIKVFKHYTKRLTVIGGSSLKQLLIVQITIIMVLFGYSYLEFPEQLGIQLLVCFGALFLYLINGVIFIILVRYSSVLVQKKNKELGLTRSEAEHHSYEQLKRANEEYQKFMHDIKKHLRVMEIIANEKQNDTLMDITHELMDKEEQITRSLYVNSNINNETLNAVLKDRIYRAQEMNIEFKLDISPAVYIDFVKPVDLVTMFGNLIDNALEGASEVNGKERFVDVRLFVASDSYIALRVSNPYKHKIRRQGEKLLTTKEEGDCHGIGLENTREAAEKYGGFVKIETEKHHFTVMLFLSNFANDVENVSKPFT